MWYPRRVLQVLPSVVLASAVVRDARAADTTAEWLTPAAGGWTEADRWSSNPFYPNNGQPAGTYDARITAAGSPYVVRFDGPAVTVERLTLGGGGSLAMFGSSLSLVQGLDLGGAGNAVYFQQGQINGGTITSSNGGILRTAGPGFSGGGAASLNDVLLDADAVVPDSSTLYLTGSTRLGPNGRVLMRGQGNSLEFATLTGQGQVLFDGAAFEFSNIRLSTSVPRVFDAGITVRTAGGNGEIGGNSLTRLVNRGSILAETPRTISIDGQLTNEHVVHASNGGSVYLRAPWSNTGSITADSGTIGVATIPQPSERGVFRVRDGRLALVGSVTTAGVRSLDVAQSVIAVEAFGTVNNAGATIPVVGDGTNTWRLAGGMVLGGTITSSGPSLLAERGDGRLSGVRLEADLDIHDGAAVELGPDTRVTARTITLSGGGRGAELELSPRAVLEPGTRIRFDGTSSLNALVGGVGLAVPAGTEVTTGTGGGTVGLRDTNSANAGLISSATPGRSITLQGIWSNSGTIRLAGGELTARTQLRNPTDPLPVVLRNAGTLHLAGGGDAEVTGSFTQARDGTARFGIAGPAPDQYGQVRVSETATLDGTLSVELTGGFSPAWGDRFDIMTWGSRSGRFSAHETSGADPGFAFAPLYQERKLTLVYAAAGDANLDRSVNGSDFALLAGNFGRQVEEWGQGDFNLDGRVDGTDFALLAGNFGRSAGGPAAAVTGEDWTALELFGGNIGVAAPEPSAVTGGLILAAAGLGLRRRRGPGRSAGRALRASA